jgi:hypothetical protein
MHPSPMTSKGHNAMTQSTDSFHLSSDASSRGNSPSHQGNLIDIKQLIFEVHGKVVELNYRIEPLEHYISLLVAMHSNSNQKQSVSDMLSQDAIIGQLPILLPSSSKGESLSVGQVSSSI